jgi:branched-chain amino acid transport system substrate-binding protein
MAMIKNKIFIVLSAMMLVVVGVFFFMSLKGGGVPGRVSEEKIASNLRVGSLPKLDMRRMRQIKMDYDRRTGVDEIRVVAVAEKEKSEILIGTHIPLSGSASLVGADQKWAYDRAVEDINKSGGIYVRKYGRKLPVRLVTVDDESNPVKAAAAVERLIKQTKVDLILSGQIGVTGVIPGMITAEKYRKYYHGTVIWVPDFLKHNFKWCTMYFIRIEDTAIMPYEVWNSLPKDERPKKPALFMEDSTDGQQLGDGLTAVGEKYGYKIVLQQVLKPGGKDFTKQILKAKAAGVDALILFADVPECVTLMRQMKKNNFSVKFVQGWKGTWATQFYDALGKDADYVLCDGFWSEDYPFQGAKELGGRYYREFGNHSVGVGMYYAVCQILWQAIERAGTLDGAKVRQAVLDNEFDTVNGKVDYDERGVAVFPVADLQWWRGKQQIVYPTEYSKYKVRIAPPWNMR